jgi:hypothetical protein
MVATTLLPCPKNKGQQSVNNFRPCVMENATVVRRHWPIITLSAAFPGKNTYDKILTVSHNDRQWSVNNFGSCIFDNLTVMEHRYPAMNLSAACVGKNSCDNITSASYNWAPTQRQQFWWMLRTLHSNELHGAVPKSSFTWSIFAICPCI